MTVKDNYSQIPYNYPVCVNYKCSKIDTCLRQLAERDMSADVPHLTIVNPKLLAAQEGNCSYYRPDARVRHAKGFIDILKSLPYSQMLTAVSHLKNYFNERTYFRVRKGERLLSPDEQKKVLDILLSCGVSCPKDFDEYVENYDW